MKKMALTNLLFFTAFSLTLLFLNTGTLAATLEPYGYHVLPFVMEQAPANSPWWQSNNDHMWLWNQYMPIYQSVAGDGTWGRNGKSEFGGFPSDSEINNAWGFHWSSGALAMTVSSWGGGGQIIESDIAFNPAYAWTTDRDAAEDNPGSAIYYDPVLLHEMGHSWGMQTRNEDYDYLQPTVMHAYNGSVVQDSMIIHAIDADSIRGQYKDQIPVPSIRNILVVSKYANHSWQNATTDKTGYFAGEKISISRMTVENTGTQDLSNVHIRFYLSPDRTITTSDTLIGDFSWPDFPAESWGEYSFTDMTIPASQASGTYYVGAMVTNNGYDNDDLGMDDTTHLRRKITVNGTSSQRTVRVISPNGGESWQAGEAKNITWTSSNAGSTVKIEISRDGGASWTAIAGSTTNDGSYGWTVTEPKSSACRIRITSTIYPEAGDTSDATFTITTATPPVPTGYPESAHPYSNRFDYTWTYTLAGSPGAIDVTFDPQTRTADRYDLIHVMDAAGEAIPGSPFTGTSLAGRTVTVPGATVKIRMVTGSLRTAWGFKVTRVAASAIIPPPATGFPESAHPYSNRFDYTWTYTLAGDPGSIHVTFDPRTFVENGRDFIYVMDATGRAISGSPFTGTSLAGRTVRVPGATVKIRLVTSFLRTYWGLKVTDVRAGT